MQYYIHSHGFGDDNRRCVALLLKGLRHLAYHPEQDRAVMPQSPPMPADHTRVVGGADFLHRSLPRPLLAPGSGSLPSPIPGGRRPQAGDPNAGQWRRLAGGQVVTIEPHVQVQLVSKLGLNEFDYFLFADHRVVQINLHTGQGRWSLFTNRHELSYFQHGYYKPTMPKGDGINDLEQLAKAIGYSQFYLQAEAWDRIKELTSKESLAMLGVFASVWVGSQFTPVGWAADALVLVMTIGGCILLGPHLLEVGSLLESFYKKATNAGRNEAQYRSAGEDFARVVTLLGVDVLMVLVFHVAKAPVNRLVVRVRQGGGGRLPGSKPAPVEEPLGEGKAKKPVRSKKTKLEPKTPEHRADRWEKYKIPQAEKGKEPMSKEEWDRCYDANMRNPKKGNDAAADAYQEEVGWGKREYPVERDGQTRKIDIGEDGRGIEVKDYSSQNVPYSEEIQKELNFDKQLAEEGWDIEWVFTDKGPSKPLEEAMNKSPRIKWKKTKK